MTTRILLFFVLIISGNIARSEEVSSIVPLIAKIQRGETDSIREAANVEFTSLLRTYLLRENSFSTAFDSIRNLSVQTSPDKEFRLYTWVRPAFRGDRYYYYGLIQLKRKNQNDTLITLSDSTASIEKPESEKLKSSRWLGSIYYSIIPVTYRKKKYYTLIGWKAKNESVTQKVLDVLYFSNGQVMFGFPLFRNGSIYRNRIIFSFSAQSSMTLRYDSKSKGIIFDHLGNNSEGIVTGAAGTYDMYKLKRGRWNLVKDVDARSKWEPSEQLPEPGIR